MKRQRIGHFSTHVEEVNQVWNPNCLLPRNELALPCEENWTHNIWSALWYERWSLGDHRQKGWQTPTGCVRFNRIGFQDFCILMLKCFVCLAAFWGLQVAKMPSAALTSKPLEACKESKKTNFGFGGFPLWSRFDWLFCFAFFWFQHTHISVVPTVQLQSIFIHNCSGVIWVWMLYSRASR